MPSPNPERQAKLRENISLFLKERLDLKLAALAVDDPRREQLTQQYSLHAWVEDAAQRVGQIQFATHTLKAIHPDAKGSNLYVAPTALPALPLVGTHVLDTHFSPDVVGNAAALDVYKFLKIQVDGSTLLDLLTAKDPDVLAILSEDPSQSEALADAFSNIVAPRGKPTSHTHAKQLYWLTSDDPRIDADYHLLAPLYPSSLVHRVFQEINEDRFGEQAKHARQARKEKRFDPHRINEYPGLAVLKLGGTKPQNVSQLNSERGGVNYLFASLPPEWVSQDVRPPLNVESIFDAFGRRRSIRELSRTLRRFLESDPDKTMATRDQRDALTDQIIDELLVYASQLQSLPAGWSTASTCRLARSECLWLDPGRTELEDAFRTEWQQHAWANEVRRKFANWLNQQIKPKLAVGDPEHAQWSKDLTQAPAWARVIDEQRRWLDRVNQQLDDFQGELGDAA